MQNPTVNYAKIIADTASNHFNVRDEFKNNTYEQNVEICNKDRLPFSVGMINVTGELNIGMSLRSACLLGAENFYIFGRKKFDRRSTVGAEKYINIVQYVFDDPIHADEQIHAQLKLLNKDIVVCDHHKDAYTLGSPTPVESHYDRNPVFIFGSESHGVPQIIADDPAFYKVSIPQRGVLRSFNVSAAMAIVCWDYIRETF